MYTTLDRIAISFFGLATFVSGYESRKLLTKHYPAEHITLEPIINVNESIPQLDPVIHDSIIETVERVIYNQDYSTGISMGLTSVILGGITIYLALSSKKAYLDELNPQINYE